MDKILIIGAGNVATNVGLGLKKAGYEIVGCYSRSIESAGFLAQTLDCLIVHDLQNLPTHDLILVCVPDASIATVITHLPSTSNIAYTSGTVSLDELPNTHKIGVFYPLQTFTKNKQIELKSVPFFVESNDESLENSLLTSLILLQAREHILIVGLHDVFKLLFCHMILSSQLRFDGLKHGLDFLKFRYPGVTCGSRRMRAGFWKARGAL
jgi:predicted short-subunit dehydrogenase-like oxidoreductase (DUF2520 family)